MTFRQRLRIFLIALAFGAVAYMGLRQVEYTMRRSAILGCKRQVSAITKAKVLRATGTMFGVHVIVEVERTPGVVTDPIAIYCDNERLQAAELPPTSP